MPVGTQTVPASRPYILQPCAVGYHSEICDMSESNDTTDAGKSETTVQRRDNWNDGEIKVLLDMWPALPKWGISRGISSPANRRQSPSGMILHWNVDSYVFAIFIN